MVRGPLGFPPISDISPAHQDCTMIEVVHLAPGKPKSETPDDEPWLIVEASDNGGSLVRAALGRLPARLCSTPLLSSHDLALFYVPPVRIGSAQSAAAIVDKGQPVS
jgi:hypothetical protein